MTTPETIDDREWIAADTNNKVCISYHDAPQGITVGCSPNAGLTFTQFASALDASHAFQIGENLIGNLAAGPASHPLAGIRHFGRPAVYRMPVGSHDVNHPAPEPRLQRLLVAAAARGRHASRRDLDQAACLD